MFNVNDQVVIKKKLVNCTRVQTGSIVDIRGSAYVVRVQGEQQSRVVNENDIASISSVFPGRKIVDHSAARRGNYKPYKGE